MARLPRSFFARPADELAPDLLGHIFVRRLGRDVLRGRIVEVEAYLGPQDQASHARNGRRTPRTEAMYARPGTLYVYFTYGVHHCLNVVCAEEGLPHAVLIRALEPLDGLDTMRRNRGTPVPDAALCRGPGNLCRALGVTLADNATDLCAPTGGIWLEEGARAGRAGRSARIGVGSAGAWAARRLRWFEPENPAVSGKRALSGRAGRT
jgi:DNA-3-methyladenine glycosylase